MNLGKRTPAAGAVQCLGLNCNSVDQVTHRPHMRTGKQRGEGGSFVHTKATNASAGKGAGDPTTGDGWTWTTIEADSKLLISYLVGGRDAEYALMLIDDLRGRLVNRIQLMTNGHSAYLRAVEDAFGSDIDYSMLVKLYGERPSSPETARHYSPSECVGARKHKLTGGPDPKHISTSYVERDNLTIRIAMRRLTRLTNASGKNLENHAHMVALYAFWHNFVGVHKTLRTSPALAAGTEARAAMVNGRCRSAD